MDDKFQFKVLITFFLRKYLVLAVVLFGLFYRELNGGPIKYVRPSS